MDKKEVYIKRDELKIFAEEFKPEGFEEGKKYPAIIVSHGFAGNCGFEEQYCEFFAAEGYVSYCFDFCGGSFPGTGRSEGKIVDNTVFSEVKDLSKVLDHVTSLPYVDNSRVVLFGTSQGGLVSSLVAAREKDRIWKLILVCPAFVIPFDARCGRLAGASYDVNNVPEVIMPPSQMPVGKKYHDEIVNFDPFVHISKFKGDVLLIHGTDDEVVNYSFAYRAKNSYAPDQCTLLMVKGAGHGFDDGQRDNIRLASKLFLEGKQQQLAIKVFVTGYELLERDENHQKGVVLFNGYADCDNFKGVILPGAKDTQLTIGNGPTKLYAEYTLEGLDKAGETARISIINQKKGDFYKPEITTDSKALSYLNDMDTTAVLEFNEGGLTVRIFG